MLGGAPGDWLGQWWLMSEPPQQAECPDCRKPWPDGLRACPACGLTIEEVAERLARK